MKREYIGWFSEARNAMARLMGDSEIADRMLQYNTFASVWSCFETAKDAETLKRQEVYLGRLIRELFEQLGTGDMFRESLWRLFLENSPEYTSFLVEYNFPCNMTVREAGAVLLQKIDALAEWKAEERVELVRPLAAYYAWNDSFFWVFVYQYQRKYPGPVAYDESRLSRFEYCEFRELENYIEKISHMSVAEQMERLTRQYCVTEFDKKYPDRETLFLDMIERGIMIPEAVKMVKTIRRSDRELTGSMEERLRGAGYSEEEIVEMKKIKYLKSRNTAITKLLYIQELI